MITSIDASKKCGLGLFFFIAIALIPIRYVHAEDNGDSGNTSNSSQNAEKTERIEVTGSHIKRIDTEGVSAVETVTKKDLDKKGYDNLGDVVRDLGVNTFGSSNTVSGNSTAPGNADISLRGLGADNTLVLLNGQRLPQDPITGTVDINLIPIAAVERIEILKDGASAIYGSDALAGVVNIITRKDFQGTELGATQSFPTNYGDGKQTKVSAVNGINGEKFNIVTSVGYRYDQAIFSRNRPWSNGNYSQIGNPASYANYDPVGQQDTGPFFTTNCPANLQQTTPGGTFCRFKYSDYSEETPQVSQIGGMSEAHYELSSDVRLNARLSYTHRDAQTIAAPSPGNFIIPKTTVQKFPFPTGWDGNSPLDLNLRLTSLGTRNTDVTNNAYGGLLGATIQLPKDWQADVTTNFNEGTSHLAGTGYVLTPTLQNLLAAGTVNPFNGTGDASSALYQPYEDTKSILSTVEAKASGDLIQTDQGPIGMAVGTLMSYSDYYDSTDPQTLAGNVLGNAGSSGGGHRTSEALYTELSVPLIKKTLELQLAGRFDHYSDFGSTLNPKVGVLYHALPSLLFRSSAGTGFRAPLLSELYAGQSTGFQSFIDAVGCARLGGVYCQAQQYQVTSGGNPNLKQETSVFGSLGAIFEPSPGDSIGADFFYTSISNTPGIDYNDMTIAELNGTKLTSFGVNDQRNSDGSLASVVAPLQNLSKTQEAGVDVTGSVMVSRVKLATEQNQLFFYKTEGFPGAGETNKLGWAGLPSWRNTSSISYFLADNQDVSLTSHSIPKQKTLDKTGYISPFTTFDFSYAYRTQKVGTFTLAVINILGSQPPYDTSNPNAQVNYALYDPNGRQLVVGYQIRL